MAHISSFYSLVTGGLQGIGRATVAALCARGDAVIVFDRVTADDQAVADLLTQHPGVRYMQVDIASVIAIKDGFSRLFNDIPQLDLLVNNAGITRDILALRMSEQDWDLVLDVNLKGAFFCAQQALKQMIKQPKSYIINVSSIVGVTGNVGQANYAASKAGLVAMTKSLAQEYASRQVLVNAIAPGFIQTPMTDSLKENYKQEIISKIPLKRLGQPGDIAKLIVFLSSGAADYITGQIIHVNGGLI